MGKRSNKRYGTIQPIMTMKKDMKNFESIAAGMQRLQMPVPDERLMVRIPGAEDVLAAGLRYFLSRSGGERCNGCPSMVR